MYIGADRPKTQKSILKVGNNIQNMIANKNKIDEMNGYDISLDAKVENDGRSETVFGQSGGGDYVHKYELSNHLNKFFNAFLPVRIFCGRAFFAPFGFLKKLFEKRNKRAFSIRIGCERGRKDKPFVFYTTKEGGELYGAIFF